MSEQEFHYSWPTRLRPHPFLRRCTPYNAEGGFKAPVEVVVFPKATEPSGYSVMSSREYLATGTALDARAAAVRFNADTRDPFSVIWVPGRTPGDPQSVGQVHVIGQQWITSIMREMVQESATPPVHVDEVLRNGQKLNGGPVPSAGHHDRTDTGLVKSVGIPPGRLRLLSRLDSELLEPGGSLTHELVIVATVPGAELEAAGLRCELAVFPKGWVTMTAASRPSAVERLELPGPDGWYRPREGRTGLGSRYVCESLIGSVQVNPERVPPLARRAPSGRRGAEVWARVLRDGVEMCRLHHPFWIKPAPTSAVAGRLQDLLDLDIGDADVARATGAAPERVREWLQDLGAPSAREAKRIRELAGIVARLTTVMKPDFIAQWLRSPLTALSGEPPLDAVLQGGYERVSRAVAALESPGAS